MATVLLGTSNVSTVGDLPAVGSHVPEFRVVKNDMTELTLADLRGKRIVFNIFPSIETGVCSLSIRKFNEAASSLKNTVVLCVSMDLPFTQKKFCGAEGLNDVVMGSDFRYRSVGESFGVLMKDGGWTGLLSRAVVVSDENGNVIYTQQVPAIGQEPDYEAALKSLA